MYLEHDIRNTTELSPTTKLFLHSLASYADHEGVCWPSQDTLALAMSMSVATVKRCIRECLELRLLEVRRRWRKSNVYKLLCVRQPELSTMGSSDELREAPPSFEKNVANARKVSPQEIHILLDDISQVMGGHLAEKNRKWFRLIARKCSYEAIQDALARVRQAILESDSGAGEAVRNPSGLFTWLLRQAGCPI